MPTPQGYRSVEGDFDKHLGNVNFTPSISNLTGTYKLYGEYQRVGKIMFFAVLVIGTSTTASSVLDLPVPPSWFPLNYPNVGTTTPATPHGEVKYSGQLGDSSGIKFITVNGQFALDNNTVTNNVRRYSGWYWVE